MGKEYLKNVFEKLDESEGWSFQVIQIKNSSKNGTSYICREVDIEPNNRLVEFIEAIKSLYCSEKGIDAYCDLDDYSGDIVDHVIYKLAKTNPLISVECRKLMDNTANPDREIPLSDIRANAALFKGVISIASRDISIMLISMQKPISLLSNKFLWVETNKFRTIDTPVLTLRKTIDVAIIEDEVFLFTLAGEKLFNMERSYRKMAEVYEKEVLDSELVSDVEGFSIVSSSGRNPRRYVSFQKERLEWLKNKKNRKKAAEIFGFNIAGDKIDTSTTEAAEKLIKFLCNKAMIDPCDDHPVEVAGTKPWR